MRYRLFASVVLAAVVMVTAPTAASAGVWHQSVGRVAADSPCEEGWYPSWAYWPNGGAGGWVCNREVDDPSSGPAVIPTPAPAPSPSYSWQWRTALTAQSISASATQSGFTVTDQCVSLFGSTDPRARDVRLANESAGVSISFSSYDIVSNTWTLEVTNTALTTGSYDVQLECWL